MAISGWDIGGAHLKLARVDQQGQFIFVEQFPLPLWKGIEYLDTLFQHILNRFDNTTDLHVITMTGELVDAFENRQQGVIEILNSAANYLGNNLFIYAGSEGWLSVTQATEDWKAVASINWQAGASLCAQQYDQGIFIDCGSTTTDIIPFKQGSITPVAKTDHERLASGELVYTGAIRTPLMALAQSITFREQNIRVAAEWFATSADIWLILGALSTLQIQDNSADGTDWSIPNSQQRLARMVGLDRSDATDNEWQELAESFAQQQIGQICDAIKQVESNHSGSGIKSQIIGAGVGHHIIKACCEELNRPFVNFTTLVQNNTSASEHAPAAAIALLAHAQFT